MFDIVDRSVSCVSYTATIINSPENIFGVDAIQSVDLYARFFNSNCNRLNCQGMLRFPSIPPLSLTFIARLDTHLIARCSVRRYRAEHRPRLESGRLLPREYEETTLIARVFSARERLASGDTSIKPGDCRSDVPAVQSLPNSSSADPESASLAAELSANELATALLTHSGQLLDLVKSTRSLPWWSTLRLGPRSERYRGFMAGGVSRRGG